MARFALHPTPSNPPRASAFLSLLILLPKLTDSDSGPLESRGSLIDFLGSSGRHLDLVCYLGHPIVTGQSRPNRNRRLSGTLKFDKWIVRGTVALFGHRHSYFSYRTGLLRSLSTHPRENSVTRIAEQTKGLSG